LNQNIQNEENSGNKNKIYSVMKKSFVSLISLFLINCCMVSGKVAVSDTLRITCTTDMYSLASTWAHQYSMLNPGLEVRVVKATDNRQAEEFIKRGMLGIVTSKNYIGIRDAAGWKTVLGRDVIVPVLNSKNPELEKINHHGVSSDVFLKIARSGENVTWSSVIPDSKNEPVHFYRTNDESMTASLSRFLGIENLNLAGKEVESSEALINAIRNDPYGIGFCRLTSVLDLNKQTLIDGIKLMPVDRNSNGSLDLNENIYTDYNQLSRGIWIGKYPKSLFSNIYATCISQPEGEASLAFMKWILTDGQKFLYDNGYNDLLLTERQSSVDKLYEAKAITTSVSETRSPFIILLILIAGTLIVILVTRQVIKNIKRSKSHAFVPIPESEKGFGESAVIVPQGLYFDKTHTWAFMEQNGMVKVGIDDFLQHITGTITRVKMKKDGSKVQKGEQILSIIQNGKNLDLYAPVSGIIREHNTVLETNSGLINSSPYNEGWVYKIEPSNWHRENQLLFYAEKYRQYLNQEFARLKDFMATVLNSGSKEYSHVILQDGGELRDGILSQMGPEVWDDFQTKYIDPSRQIWFYELF
jgi:glycine cleavage system H lipoate-binding protein/ABC-type phosphate transport system substrate-binding protein